MTVSNVKPQRKSLNDRFDEMVISMPLFESGPSTLEYFTNILMVLVTM